jgi:hypothetical protein
MSRLKDEMIEAEQYFGECLNEGMTNKQAFDSVREKYCINTCFAIMATQLVNYANDFTQDNEYQCNECDHVNYLVKKKTRSF